ncbi:MAG TPA: GNAT family N-acetyltransferase [Anaerolineae bacterium]|nr:GNAT family N-acetyltransferase [Anaerolineae bacterium]
MTWRDKTLVELVEALPAELNVPVRDAIELLLERYAQRTAGEKGIGPSSGAPVTLREVTADTVRAVCRLSDTLVPPKRFMVAPNSVSLAQALFEPKAWYRAIYADETLVGFVMLYDDPDEPEYYLWRFMIATPHQGKGFGRQTIERMIEYVETRPGAVELLVSCGEGPGNPEGFYTGMGFRRTGKMSGDEVELVLPLPYRRP